MAAGGSVLVAQRELHVARGILSGRAGDAPKIRVGDVQTHRKPILHVIERVEEIGAQQQLVSLPGHGKGLGDSYINVFHAVPKKRVASNKRHVSTDVVGCQGTESRTG